MSGAAYLGKMPQIFKFGLEFVIDLLGPLSVLVITCKSIVEGCGCTYI
jgi:hypothetical protein